MSIDAVLSKLVSDVDGATAAIILGADGEAIQWHATKDAERLRLRGAYVAVVFQCYRDSIIHRRLGSLRDLVLEYDGSSFIAEEIDNDCFVALELAARANIGAAMFRLRRAANALRLEF